MEVAKLAARPDYLNLILPELEETCTSMVCCLYLTHLGYPKLDANMTLHQAHSVRVLSDLVDLTLCHIKQYSNVPGVITKPSKDAPEQFKNEKDYPLSYEAPRQFDEELICNIIHKNLRFEEQTKEYNCNIPPSISSILRRHPISSIPGSRELLAFNQPGIRVSSTVNDYDILPPWLLRGEADHEQIRNREETTSQLSGD